jgi:hypothetical protein
MYSPSDHERGHIIRLTAASHMEEGRAGKSPERENRKRKHSHQPQIGGSRRARWEKGTKRKNPRGEVKP